MDEVQLCANSYREMTHVDASMHYTKKTLMGRTHICCACREGEQLSHILLGLVGHQLHLVHGWDGADEDYTQTTRRCCSRLDSDVFLRAQVSMDNPTGF